MPLEDFEHYGVMQYRSRPTGKWRTCRDERGNPECMGWNGDWRRHIPRFAQDHIRLHESGQNDENDQAEVI